MTISRQTRHDIIKSLLNPNSFAGSSEPDAIMEMLDAAFDLRLMPSTDRRFSDARADIVQHIVNNNDWDYEFLFYERLNVLNVSDKVFMALLEAIVRTTLRRSDTKKYVDQINSFIIKEGYQLRDIGINNLGLPIYKISNEADSSAEKTQSELNPMQAKDFAKAFGEYLNNLPEKYAVREWTNSGKTNVAYKTPTGAWDVPGFIFESKSYSFIIRSIAPESGDPVYIVVESNELEGQLANLQISDGKKFSNENGNITIREGYDMTVGTRRSRAEIQDALQRAGMKNDVITTFHQEQVNWDQIIADILQWAIYREEAKKLMQSATSVESTSELSTNPDVAKPITKRLQETLPQIISDSASRELEDELEFTSDINAIASVIALKEVKPPLAIGLFGNWGSGKSFFMNKLQDRIDKLRLKKDSVFCNEVLQINFNSWHYSDSNLWASLITKIFEELEQHGKDRSNEVRDLFLNLNSTKELLEETRGKKEVIDRELKKLNVEKTVKEKDIKEQANKLKSLSFKEILSGVVKNHHIQDQINNLKNTYDFLDLRNYDDVDKNINKLSNFFDSTFYMIRRIRYYFSGSRLFFTLISFAALYLLLMYVLAQADTVSQLIPTIKATARVLGVCVLFILNISAPARNLVREIMPKLKSLQGTINELKIEAQSKFDDQRHELNDRIAKAQRESEQVQEKIEGLEIEQKNLENEIDNIASGKKIIRFIEGRASDARYINSLGIISWIRKDFEQLDKLLRQQKEAWENTSEHQGNKPSFHVDRIILYIDDLDRCNEEIVIKVLQAIHLLLAFPLFVVVVGVDPRWLNNALNRVYSHLLTNGNQPLDQTAATSYDYLEKVFQIPLTLKNMDVNGKKKLIASQFIEKSGERPSQSLEIEEKIDAATVKNHQLNEPPMNADSPQSAAPPEPSEASHSSEEGIAEKSGDGINVSSLVISQNEQLLMQEIHFLLSDSPRSIKRFVNIYRIIRAHSYFEHDADNETGDYFSAMIILAIIIGLPEIARDFCISISNEDSDTLFGEFLEKKIEAKNDVPNSFGILLDLLRDGSNKIVHPFSSLTLRRFQNNMDLVTRFSFRTMQYK